MKKKLFTLTLILSFFYTFLPNMSVLHAEEALSAGVSNELPSNAFLQKEKRSLGADYGQSMLTSKQAISPFSDDPWGGSGSGSGWDGPESGWGDGNSGNVAGPIGDITLPIIFSILILYLGYRRVSTSRRRNDI